jgi:DNA-binding SARP family transcriptional activator
VQVREGKLSLDRRRCTVDVWAVDALLGEIEVALRGNGKGGEAQALAPLGERVLALYGGAFLRDEREQPWMLPLREQLKSRFIRAAALLGERLEAQGATGDALALYDRALGRTARSRPSSCGTGDVV